MLAFYNLEANPLTNRLKETIIHLNTLVVNECTKMVKCNIDMYYYYLHDASNLPIPLDRGIAVTSKQELQPLSF
jgi:hypothetical protein